MSDQPHHDFLRVLYPDGLPLDTRLLIWEDAGKASLWYGSIQRVPNAQPQQANVYVGCGLASKSYGKHRRCPAHEIAAIPGFWADLDVESEGDPKARFSDKAAAHNFLAGLPVTPTVVVDSGNGLQAWWLFKEPWVFDSDDERTEAAALTRGFGGRVRSGMWSWGGTTA